MMVSERQLSSLPLLLVLVIMLLATVGLPRKSFAQGDAATAADGAALSLTAAVERFNLEAKADPIGKAQPVLTKEEIVAAIRMMGIADAEVPVNTLTAIARTQELPAGAHLEVMTLLDGGEDFVVELWFVRLGVMKPDGQVYYLPIRKQYVGSRTVAEELIRLETLLAAAPQRPGRSKLEARAVEIRARAEKVKQANPM